MVFQMKKGAYGFKKMWGSKFEIKVSTNAFDSLSVRSFTHFCVRVPLFTRFGVRIRLSSFYMVARMPKELFVDTFGLEMSTDAVRTTIFMYFVSFLNLLLRYDTSEYSSPTYDQFDRCGVKDRALSLTYWSHRLNCF